MWGLPQLHFRKPCQAATKSAAHVCHGWAPCLSMTNGAMNRFFAAKKCWNTLKVLPGTSRAKVQALCTMKHPHHETEAVDSLSEKKSQSMASLAALWSRIWSCMAFLGDNMPNLIIACSSCHLCCFLSPDPSHWLAKSAT